MAVPKKRKLQRPTFARTKWGIVVGIAVLIIAVGSWAAYQSFLAKPGKPIPIQQPVEYHLRAGETFTYNSIPPTSGPHSAAGTDWGIHDLPIPNEIQVHMLEHGGVIIQYLPSESPALEDPISEGLKRLVGRLRTENFSKYCKLILAPYPLLTEKIALTAWGRLDTFDAEEITPEVERRIQDFADKLIDAYNPERVGCP